MFVVFDIETTGLSTSSDDIIEFAYILFDDNNRYVRGEQLYFYYEGMTWSEEAYNIHQIPLSFLEQHKDNFHANLAKMYSVLNYNTIIGHNSDNFDSVFVMNWLARMGIDTLTYGLKFDTMKIYKPITKRSRIKLIKLVELAGITHDQIVTMMGYWFPNANLNTDAHAHDAAYDTTETCLLALQAIRNGLLDVNRSTAQTQRDLPSTDSLYSEGKPAEALVYIPLVEYPGGRIEYQSYCKSEELMKYKQILDEEDMAAHKHTACCFPKAFCRIDGTNKFSAQFDTTTFVFEPTETGDILTLEAPYGSFDCKDMNLFKTIANLSK